MTDFRLGVLYGSIVTIMICFALGFAWKLYHDNLPRSYRVDCECVVIAERPAIVKGEGFDIELRWSH